MSTSELKSYGIVIDVPNIKTTCHTPFIIDEAINENDFTDKI